MLQVTHRPWRDVVARVDSQEFWDGLLPGLKPRPTGRVELGDANLILKGDGGSFDPLQFPSVGSGENQLREFGRPYGAYLVGWGYDPRATPSATIRVALGYSRRLPTGATAAGSIFICIGGQDAHRTLGRAFLGWGRIARLRRVG